MSHRTRTADSSAILPATTYGKAMRTTKPQGPTMEKPLTASHRLSMTSNSSGGKRSSTSLERPTTSRPSGIPRPTKTSSISRQNNLVPSRPTEIYISRTKVAPNITGIGTRTTLRNLSATRSTPSNNTPRIVTDEDMMGLEPSLPSLDVEHDVMFGIAIPQKQPQQTSNLPPRLIPELQALAAATYRRPTPAMSTISTISSPSTQFTPSPSPWSASTNATTPTSWSSASPSIVQSTSKRSQTVPLLSKVRTRMPNLPVLQESAASSASSSKANIQTEGVLPVLRKTKKRTPLNSPAPTPPPRTSSVKRNRSRSNSKNEEQPGLGTQSAPPLPREQDISPTLKHVQEVAKRQSHSFHAPNLTDNHQKLQEALNSTPLEPRPNVHDRVPAAQLRGDHLDNARLCEPERGRRLLEAAPIERIPRSDSQASLELNKAPEMERPRSASRSRSRLAKFSRLAFFGKSSKMSEDTDTSRQTRKLQRRGPVAGTGHEGYARFGRREKRTSRDGYTTGNESESSVVSDQRKPSRSTSAHEESRNKRRDRSSQSDLDDFASSRLKPVVILGGSKISGDSQPETIVRQVAASHTNIESKEMVQDGQDPSSHASVTSSGPLMRESRLIFHLDSLDLHEPSNLALRRSQKFEKVDHFPALQPIDTTTSSNPPYLRSYNTSQSSIAPTSAAMTDASTDPYKVDSQLPEKQRKKSRKLNWGFFKRKASIPESYQPLASSRTVTPKMAVTVSAVPPPRPMPYYAMLESDNDITNTETISEFLTEAARSMPMDDDTDAVSPIDERELELDMPERPISILLPSTPQLKPNREAVQPKYSSYEFEEQKVQPSSAQVATAASQLEPRPRQPRLAQVGRIPKVVPTTQKENLSRPPQIQSVLPIVQKDQQLKSSRAIKSGKLPILAIDTKVAPTQTAKTRNDTKPGSTISRSGMGRSLSHGQRQAGDISKTTDRYSTTSSSSDGVISVMGPPLLPGPEFPMKSTRYTTTEDDIWNEYDEFIDRVISSPRLKKSRARITDEDRSQPLVARIEAPMEKAQARQKIAKQLAIDTSLAPPPILFTSPISMDDQDSIHNFQLRRSRIISALHSSIDPSSPFSIGDYIAELGEPKRRSDRASGRLSDSAISQSGHLSPLSAFTFPEPPVSRTEYKHYENAMHMEEVERSKDPAKHSEHSYASLMVSRWLSFGRVLFSPAHADIQKLPERHVLVIDGLGNEDWSIYCAVTYQSEQAYIYDLKETGHTRSSTSPTKNGNTPQNLRRRELASFNQAFNFPDNFFSVIVLRFPPVMAESKLKNIIAECRRVLAPGGFMELMLLDLDMVNMGVLTRRAMRELKTQIAMHNREVSLKPVIDNVQGVLGEKGFSKLSKCVVGVPVVGKPPGAESPTSSRSSGNSDRFRKSPSAGPRPFDGMEGQHHHNFSLNDLVADHSDNADAKIGRVVSRTARSWWQHCFEAAIISDGNLAKSIFADKQVLDECKSRASSFRLLIAYTQKPMTSAVNMKRRTMSEPVIATLATAKTP